MEKVTKKSVALKIAIVLVVVLLFNFSAPTISQASVADVIGGTLLSPILDLLIALGDGVISVLQSMIFGIDDSLVKVSVREASVIETIGKVAGAIAGIAIVIGVTILVPTLTITWGTILTAVIAGTAGAYAGYKITTAALPDSFYLPVYAISPEEIFENRIALLDVNFFNPNEYDDDKTATGEAIEQTESTASVLQSTISSWYLTLRNLALVVLLSVLLYIGIRIVTSSSSGEKAKYKERLSSWIIAMCLLFFMHYIMAFATTIVEAITEGINTINEPIIVDMPDLQEEDYVIEVTQTDDDGNPVTDEDGDTETAIVDAYDWFSEADLIANDAVQEDGSTETRYLWPTNLMGRLRIEMQMDDNLTEDNQTLRQVGYVVLFLVLVIYTIAFLVVYIKRVVMLAFLTMIAPLVAMTYPLDKMGDGNAQAFNTWLKEYAYNLLIQPFHLILYTMLVGSAIDFAADHMIYAIVALGFILEAEKIMKRFFGFDKASTIDANGSAVGGALAMAGIQQLGRFKGRPPEGGRNGGRNGGNSNSGSSSASRRKLRTSDLLDQVSEGSNGAANTAVAAGTAATGAALGAAATTGRGRGRLAGNGQSDDDENGTTATLSVGGLSSTDGSLNGDTDGKSDEWQRLENARIELNNDLANEAISPEEFAARDREIRESDQRDIRTWAGDLYSGSRLQEVSNSARQGLHAAQDAFASSRPVEGAQKFTRNLASGAKSVREMAAEGIRANVPKPIRNSIRMAGDHLGNIASGVGAVGSEALKDGANALKNAAPKVAKTAVKLGAATTVGIAGAAAGLASDGKTGQSVAAGLAAGYSAGGAVANTAERAMAGGGKDYKDVYRQATQGSEAAKQRKIDIEERAAMKDKERQKLYKEELGIENDEELNKVMEQASEFRRNGIMDDEVIIAAMGDDRNLTGDRNSPERMLAAAIATDTGRDSKKLDEQENKLKEKLSEEDAKRIVDAARKITGAL